ncbi:methyltransferase domain-containing protein [Pseudonocardiaceae bacterium YIM PH 21723]|nr:methyltransferase domain-containing protein [Pseudonocardiaceae bacterium YIM PH 21723]
MTLDTRSWDRHASWSEQVAVAKRPAMRLIRQMLQLKSGDRVLEVGCGTGWTLPALSAAVGPEGSVVAVDYSPAMVARAQARVAREGLSNVRVIQADAADMPLEPGSFDAVLAMYAISATRDVPAVVRAVHDVVRPGGRVFVMDVHLAPSTSPLARSLRWLYRRMYDWTGVNVLAELTSVFPEVTAVDGKGRRVERVPDAVPVMNALAIKNA